MKLITAADIAGRSEFFEELAHTEKSQVASMIIAPAKTSGEYGTDHPDSDQALIVLSGEAVVEVEGENVDLHRGDLCLIEAGEKHRVRNTGLGTLRTLNVYSPKAY
jgi:mannose-6-phosphate isomerase-like protein (cupin superfamily)